MHFEPNEPIWVYNHAIVCLYDKDFFPAAASFSKFVQMKKSKDPNFQLEIDHLETGARIFNSIGQKEQAVKMLQQLGATAPERAAELEKQFETTP